MTRGGLDRRHAVHKNLRDIFEVNRARTGEELDPSEVKDPHLNEWMLLAGYDGTDLLSLRITRWKYPKMKNILWKIKMNEDVLLGAPSPGKSTSSAGGELVPANCIHGREHHGGRAGTAGRCGSREPQLGSDKVRARRLVRTSASSTRVEDGQRRTGLAHESPHTAEVDARVCQRAVWEFLCRKIVVASPLLVLEGASC
jgi:hypothetical protein